MFDRIRRIAGLLALAAPLAAAAAPAAPATAPADAGPLTTEAFFRPAQYERVKLSPTGRYIALTTPLGEQTRLAIIDITNMHITALFTVTQQHHVNDFFWVDPQRVVFNTLVKLGSLDIPVVTSEWFAGNAAQDQFFSIGAVGTMLGRDRDNPGRVLVVNDDFVSSVNTYMSPTNGGRWKEVSKIQLGFEGEFLLDSTRRARVAWSAIESVLRDIHLRVRGRDELGWREVKVIADPRTQHVRPLMIAPDDERVYVSSNEGAATNGLVLWDPRTGKSELVFRHPDVDIDDALVLSIDGKTPLGVEYTDDRRREYYFDAGHPDAKLYREIGALYPDEQTSFTSFSDDGQQAIVMTWSDVNPGTFNLLDVKAGTIRPLIARRPWIDPKRMAPMKPIALKARDGTPLHGYVTLPPGAAPSRVPMIVMVHGGPHERDRWGFDPEVQFLASRGFAVLQVNFRGSSGYGAAFARASEARWGLEPQDDVTDATRWAIAQGIADPDRICIYGTSYGGYSALMGVIREPALYRCAAGASGIYDLAALKYEGDTSHMYWGTEWLWSELGKDKQIARRNSPANRADEIRVPVFLAHGGKDARAPFNQFRAMKGALEDAGRPPETLVYDKEGHGFSLPAHQIEFHDKLAAFFARNTAPKASTAPAAPGN